MHLRKLDPRLLTTGTNLLGGIHRRGVLRLVCLLGSGSKDIEGDVMQVTLRSYIAAGALP